MATAGAGHTGGTARREAGRRGEGRSLQTPAVPGYPLPVPTGSRPTLLLFDLGGVLVENVVFERLAPLLPAPAPRAALQDRWLASAAVRAFDLGRIEPDVFAEVFVAEWGLTLSPASFLEEFASWPRGLYPGARALLDDLRRRFRVACLSNSNALHWERFGGFPDGFDVSLSSHLLGAVKPDAEAFRRALATLGVGPTDLWFFDDSAANVHAAAALGIRAFRTEGLAAVEAVLRAEGCMAWT